MNGTGNCSSKKQMRNRKKMKRHQKFLDHEW